MTDRTQDSNFDTYCDERVAREYAGSTTLLVPETVLIDAYDLGRAEVLDIGVGGGRTTAHLHARCRRYVGIDYSPAMLGNARRRLPTCDLRLMRAEDLSAFQNGEFDLVLFSHNGIDAAPHDTRLTILREIRRVLRPSGTLLFSSHNRGAFVEPARMRRHLTATSGERRLSRLARYVAGILNEWRLKPHLKDTSEYAVRNDWAHDYRLLHYYIHPLAQQQQLELIGFEVVHCVDIGGRTLTLAEAQRSSDPWLYYEARPRSGAPCQSSSSSTA